MMASPRFSYVKYDEDHAKTQGQFKAAFECIERMAETLPDGRAKDNFFNALEEAYMWTGKAIRDSQIGLTGKVDEQPERNNE